MPCPVCGRVYCDHEPEERGQTRQEMLADMAADAAGGWDRVERVNRERGIETITGLPPKTAVGPSQDK